MRRPVDLWFETFSGLDDDGRCLDQRACVVRVIGWRWYVPLSRWHARVAGEQR